MDFSHLGPGMRVCVIPISVHILGILGNKVLYETIVDT